MTTDLDSTTGVVPFGWEHDPTAKDSRDGLALESRHRDGEEETFFRFPAANDPAPATGRLLAMALYASALGLAGVGLGVRGFVSLLSGTAPGFYIPVLALVGLISVALVVGAFLSIHRRVLPYVLLVAAAVPLAGDFWLAGLY